jgi:hypothetical protein
MVKIKTYRQYEYFSGSIFSLGTSINESSGDVYSIVVRKNNRRGEVPSPQDKTYGETIPEYKPAPTETVKFIPNELPSLQN